jgi:hypothetical protein
MRNDEARERMGQKAIEVRVRYSLESILTMWDKLFNEAISDSAIKRKLQA